MFPPNPAGLCGIPAVFQPRGEHPPGGAAHALLQGKGNRTLCPKVTFPHFVRLVRWWGGCLLFLTLTFFLRHCSQVSEDVPVSLSFRGKGYALKVAYDNSVDLVLAASREYFNSSATLKDPCMGLAR